MKKLLLIALLFSTSLSSISAQDLDFGAGIQLVDGFEILGLQGKAIYGIDEKFDIAGAFTFYLEDGTGFGIDIDGQYKLLNVSDKFNLYPIAGLNVTKYSTGSNFGINIGAMFDFVFESYRFYAEPKIILKDGSPIVISGGILF